MRLEVVNTGTELLLGQVVNTHVAYFGDHLLPLGIRIQRQTTVPDGAVIGELLREVFPRTDAVLITGGLGPTSDDVTREVVAELLGRELRLDEALVEHIRGIFARYGRVMPESNARQAMVPQGAVVLDNPQGTAPGLYFPAAAGEHPHLFILPGPPRELKPMFQNEVLPRLKAMVEGTGRVTTFRNLRVVGVGESQLAEVLEPALLDIGGLEIGYCARLGEVDVRVIGPVDRLDRAESLVRTHFPDQFVNADGRSLEQTVVELLAERRLWLATAESCTGGMIASKVTDVPGASAVFRQGYVTYANAAKTELLGVAEALLEEHGAVSEPVARAMAEGALQRAGTDYAVAVTGIAGPGGGTPGKPVGTVYVAVARRGLDSLVKRYQFVAERLGFKERTTRMALELVRRGILGLDPNA
ncbi:MAG: competence/damage-inducible protein A [Verrucomicrobia bacterium]|nr:competence/damage-inducible protein A [Verrucomicrobiota bacterium]